MILGICDDPQILSMMRIIDILITAIKIIVPTALIIFLSVDYTKVISSGDNDALKQAHKTAIRRLLAAVLIFCVPTGVKVIANATVGDLEYSKCLANASVEGIRSAYYSKAEKLVSSAEISLSNGDYSLAKVFVNDLEEGEDKENFKNRLNNIEKLIGKVNNESKKELTNTIFIGDSKINNLSSSINSNEVIINNISSLNDVLDDSTSYNIVLSYGSEDLDNYKKYCNKYKELASSVDSNNKIFVTSVNPISEELNDKVINFNNKLKECVSEENNIYYCDTYSSGLPYKWYKEYVKKDGTYTEKGSKHVYNSIKDCVSKRASIESSTVLDSLITYNQFDYPKVPYCVNTTISSSGCGPTGYAMIATNLLGEKITPPDVAKVACVASGNQDHGSSYHMYNRKYINEKFGLKNELLFDNHAIYGYSGNANYNSEQGQKMFDAVYDGKIILLWIPGHFVVVGPNGSCDRDEVYLYNTNNGSEKNGCYTPKELFNATYNHGKKCTKKSACGWLAAVAYSANE